MKEKKYEYAVNEVPPVGHLLVSAFQHVLIMIVSIGFPVIFASQINGSAELTAALIAFTMLSCGIGSIIQSIKLPFLGSGYLCPNLCGPSYLSLSLSAAWVGGIPLMRGMIIIAGLVEMLISPIVQKLRSIFPTYVIGLVVALVGISVIKMSVASIFGVAYQADAIRNTDIMIGVFSLLLMVLSNVWGKGYIKMYCLLIGMIIGWVVACLVEPDYWMTLRVISKQPFFALPRMTEEYHTITFDWKMLIPFIVIGISGSLKSFGNLLAAQKISEPELKETNFKPIRNGLMADGISTVFAGLVGGLAVDTSSSNVGLAASTKVLSRWISIVAGIIFIVLAFFPQFLTALSLMPKPVLGAGIVFTGCFMICTGLLEMFSEKWDQRKTFVIGISLFLGLSTAFLPGLYARAPKVIQTVFTDPLPTATFLAVFLNQLLNLDLLFKKKEN